MNSTPFALTVYDDGGGINPVVSAPTVYDDGEGAALYAGGGLTTAGGVAANRIAKWDRSSRSALGGGLDGGVHTLTAYGDGRQEALYAGGSFPRAIDAGDSYLARWGCPPPASIASVTPLPQPGAGGIRK